MTLASLGHALGPGPSCRHTEAHVCPCVPVDPSPALSGSLPIANTRISAVGLWAPPSPYPHHTHTITPRPGMLYQPHLPASLSSPAGCSTNQHPGSGWIPTAAHPLCPRSPGSSTPTEHTTAAAGVGSCLFHTALTFKKFLLPAFSKGRFHIKIY